MEPGLYIGDRSALTNLAFLRHRGISHVLNAAEGRDEGRSVFISSSYFERQQ